MRVKCNSFEEFCSTLQVVEEDGNRLHQNAVHVSVVCQPWENSTTQDVIFHGSAVVVTEEGSYLVDFSAHAGVDRPGAPGECDLSGSETADAWVSAIKSVSSGWRILPGVVEL